MYQTDNEAGEVNTYICPVRSVGFGKWESDGDTLELLDEMERLKEE
jgi:hypothetical protein